MRLVCQNFSSPLKVTRKKRRVESFDETVDWCQKGLSVRDSSVWLSKRLSDGKSSEVTYHRLLPGQQLQFDEAMTKELLQVLAANAVRRLSQEEELNP